MYVYGRERTILHNPNYGSFETDVAYLQPLSRSQFIVHMFKVCVVKIL